MYHWQVTHWILLTLFSSTHNVSKPGKDKKVQFGRIKEIWWLGEGVWVKMSFLDLVTIGWDGCFGLGEHEDESTCVEEDEPKVYKISW